jgi:hypothetical protein
MNCQKAKNLFSTYIKGELEKAEQMKLTEHLIRCAICAHELEALNRTWNLLDAWEEIDVPEFLTQQVERQVASLAATEAAKKEREVKAPTETVADGRWHPLKWFFAGAGAAMAFCILAFLVVKPFILQGYMKVTESEIAKQAENGIAKQAGEIKIEFYLTEHERAAQHATLYTVAESKIAPQFRIPMRREDIFYYDAAPSPGLAQKGQSGLILRTPHLSTGEIKEPDEAMAGNEKKDIHSAIAESDIINVEEAQKLMPFKIVAPKVLAGTPLLGGVGGGYYQLAFILKIKEKECVQLVYSNGAQTISLFEQPLWTKNGIGRQDFQQYILYKAQTDSQNSVLGWHTHEIVFNLVSEAKFLDLMAIAEEVQERERTDKFQNFYEQLYGK